MTDYIALFRGINVGGRNLVPMKELVTIMEDCGHVNIQTYIQSGNVVFSGKSKSSDQIVNLIAERKGFRPELLVLDVGEFEQAIKNNPFESAEGKACHFTFCKTHVSPKAKIGQRRFGSKEDTTNRRISVLGKPSNFQTGSCRTSNGWGI